ncbi:nischarin-like [Chrysoperla carnea]|uniref:nischarin-like n=1 Tax=Chrysoperla carnea TaxID=189513 RepID=UPI001D087422|nr:nischarin-like [Chrysoperla carnea]
MSTECDATIDLNCLTTYGSIIRQKREAPAEAAAVAAPAAAEAAKAAPAVEAAKAAPGTPPPAPGANPISGPMNSAAAQMTAAVQPFMAHMDKLGTEGAELQVPMAHVDKLATEFTSLLGDGIGFVVDLFNPAAYFGF